MSAISVFECKPNIVNVTGSPWPSLEEVPDGRGVLVEVLRVGLDCTEREIDAEEGAVHPGYDFLVLGHEGFGRVEAVGPNVTHLKPGDYVVTGSRKAIRDRSISQAISGHADGRRFNFRRSFLTEYYVDDASFTAKVPEALKHIGGLLEPSMIGNAAITGNTSAMILQAFADEMPVSPLHLNSRLPWRLEEIVSSLLKKDGRLRYRCAHEIRTDVARLKRNAAAGIRAMKATLAWRRPGARWHFAPAGILAC